MSGILKRGSRGLAVKNLQQRLLDLGYQVQYVDGMFGPITHSKVVEFQQDKGLSADGVVGPNTRRVLYGEIEHIERITPNTIQTAAQELEVEVPMVQAVSEVESHGDGFDSNGKPKILFERHWMYKLLCRHRQSYLAQRLSQSDPDIVNRRPGGYRGGSYEWQRLEKARQHHETSALMSASYGKYQIMGFHWERLGYMSVNDYVDQMSATEDNHLVAFTRFIKSDRRLHQAMRDKEFSAFAYYYNGPAYANMGYHLKLENAYNRYRA